MSPSGATIIIIPSLAMVNWPEDIATWLAAHTPPYSLVTRKKTKEFWTVWVVEATDQAAKDTLAADLQAEVLTAVVVRDAA